MTPRIVCHFQISNVLYLTFRFTIFCMCLTMHWMYIPRFIMCYMHLTDLSCIVLPSRLSLYCFFLSFLSYIVFLSRFKSYSIYFLGLPYIRFSSFTLYCIFLPVLPCIVFCFQIDRAWYLPSRFMYYIFLQFYHVKVFSFQVYRVYCVYFPDLPCTGFTFQSYFL